MQKRKWHIRCLPAFLAGFMFIPSVFAAWYPGLKAGYLDSSWDTNSYPTVTESQLGPHAAKTQAKPPWADNRTWVYTGQIYLNGDTYHFAESIDDASFLAIDGVTLLNDRVHNVVTKSGDVATDRTD